MSVQEELGFGPRDRVVVIHVDDIGLCAAANEGALLALAGAATCGSVMVPCGAFEAIAQTARERPELDLGVHLTLNAEYESYRWGPLRSDVPGLCAPDGGLWRTLQEVVEHASPEEVERELRAQLERALEAGIDVTHLDSHMGTVFHLKFAPVYLRLARDYRLPAMLPRIDRELLAARGLLEQLADYIELVEGAERAGAILFDRLDADSLHFAPGAGLAHNTARLEALPVGLSYLITHCASGGPELESIAPDWRARDEECRIYSDGTMAAAIQRSGVRPIGMRPLRDLVRTRGTTESRPAEDSG